MNDWLGGMATWWKSRTPLQRGLLGVGAVVVLLAAAMLATPKTTNYVTLIRDMPLADTRALQAVLADEGIPHRLVGDGDRIEVPIDAYPRARVALASPEVTQLNGVGFEVFEKSSWGMTEFTAKVQYRRALEGELGRSIMRLDDIAMADVRLTVPERNTLRTLRVPAQAAVILKTRSGKRPSDETVAGVAQLVGRAVEGLEPSRVAVLDGAGRLMSVSDSVGTSRMTTAQLDIQRAVENEISNKVLSLLTPVVGEGHVRAEVSASINFDAIDRLDERLDPNSTVLLNERRSETPPEFAVDSLGERGGLVVDNTYGATRTTERIVRAPGGIRRLTVAVLIDDTEVVDEEARTALVAKAEAVVRSAVGLVPERGDVLTVAALGFASLRRDEADTSELAAAEAAAAGGRELWYLAGGLLLAGVVWLLMRRRETPDESLGLSGDDLVPSSPDGAEDGTPPSAGPPTPVEVLRSTALSIVSERPDTAVQVVRVWVSEGRF